MRHRQKAVLAAIALLLVAMAVHRPSADIRILTHESGDARPHQMQAAVHTGLFAVHLLITWTAKAVR